MRSRASARLARSSASMAAFLIPSKSRLASSDSRSKALLDADMCSPRPSSRMWYSSTALAHACSRCFKPSSLESRSHCRFWHISSSSRKLRRSFSSLTAVAITNASASLLSGTNPCGKLNEGGEGSRGGAGSNDTGGSSRVIPGGERYSRDRCLVTTSVFTAVVLVGGGGGSAYIGVCDGAAGRSRRCASCARTALATDAAPATAAAAVATAVASSAARVISRIRAFRARSASSSRDRSISSIKRVLTRLGLARPSLDGVLDAPARGVGDAVRNAGEGGSSLIELLRD
mmetsp:Transcript_12169/g.56454  ORF Transcript_12169/g.56454 Transcript_12169/m.56454 type:complete len:288 (+) Transcript_12169:1385-2248(+)